MTDDKSLKRIATEAPASQNDMIDEMMDDASVMFFQMMVRQDFNAIRDALVAHGWTVTPIGGIEYTQSESVFVAGDRVDSTPHQLRVLPYRGGDGMIMARYQIYDPVFFCCDKEGVIVSGFKQELRPIVDILKEIDQRKLTG